MNPDFLWNLARVLAHTQVREAQAAETVPGGIRADINTTTKAPDVSRETSESILAQMQAMSGTGRFAQTGSLPSLIARTTPTYVDTAGRGISQFLGGSATTPGFLQVLQSQVAPALSTIQTQQRGADVADIANLGPGAIAAMRKANPQVAQLYDTLMGQAQSELDLGAKLDPSLMRQAQDTIRSRYQGRLGGTGPAGDLNEAIGVSAYANELRNQRRAFAGQVAQAAGDYYNQPLWQSFSRSNPASVLAAGQQGISGYSSAAAPVLGAFDLQSPLAMQNLQNTFEAAMQNSRLNAAREQKLMSFFSGMAGGGMSML